MAGSPRNYWTIQEAYNDAKVSGQAEVIGLYSKTTENLTLDGAKSLTITQCASAQVSSASSTKPVWDITSTGKLTIIGPDAVGGTIGWRVATGGHDIKSVRATGASQYGILLLGSGNSLSFNSVSGSPEGIRVQGSSNDIRGGTVSGNTTGVDIAAGATGNFFRTATVGINGVNGIVVAGTGNTVRDDSFNANGINGVFVSGANNTIYNNSSYSNSADGFNVTGLGNLFDTDKAYKNFGDGFEVGTAASGTKLRYDESNTGAANGPNENVGYEYRLGYAITNLGGNKKDTLAFTATAKGWYE